jgi:hypothetical protein
MREAAPVASADSETTPFLESSDYLSYAGGDGLSELAVLSTERPERA